MSLKKETDALSQSRLKDIEKELAELQDKFKQMKAQWENEKNAISKVQSLREQIEQTNAAIEKAQREYDLNKAAELKYGRLPELQKQLEAEEKLAADKKEASLLRDRVTDEEIARIVGPLDRHPGGEAGGGRAGETAPSGRRAAQTGDRPGRGRHQGQRSHPPQPVPASPTPTGPIGSFLFLGPTGVGKTELAKALGREPVRR